MTWHTPNDYYNGAKFVFLWYDMANPNDYYKSAKCMFYGMTQHILMIIIKAQHLCFMT